MSSPATVEVKAATVEVKAFEEAMRAEYEKAMRGVMEAVNAAPRGQWIEGSEHQVRDLMRAFQEKAYEKALQMRTQAAEAAFSPSACGSVGGSTAFQGVSGAQRADAGRSGGGASARLHGPGVGAPLAGR